MPKIVSVIISIYTQQQPTFSFSQFHDSPQSLPLQACQVTSVVSNSDATPWIVAHQAPLCMGFSRQEYWKGLPRSPPGDLLTQGSNPGCLHCSQILYRLSHQGSFPLQIEGLCQPCIKQVHWCHFSKIIGSLPVSMSYFGDSSNTSTFLMIIKFVMVTCDQRYLMLLF